MVQVLVDSVSTLPADPPAGFVIVSVIQSSSAFDSMALNTSRSTSIVETPSGRLVVTLLIPLWSVLQ